MSEEYLDLVDENGKLTGERELRSVCHAKGLWHQVVSAYLFREHNGRLEILTHLRTGSVKQSFNKWVLRFGGHVESGSTFEETIIREMQEEIGLNLKLSDLILGIKTFQNNADNREIAQAYYYNFTGDVSQLSFDNKEIEAVSWMNFDEIKKSIRTNPEIWAANLLKSNELYLIEKALLSKIA